MTDTTNDGRPRGDHPAPPKGETVAATAKDEAILRDERQTARQAPDTASPGEGASN
jgi:hypothetical protein